MELEWFQRVLARRPAEELPPVPGSGTDPDAEFRLEPGDTVERIYVHLIQETARHDGHADILREQLEGTTGT